MTGGSSLGFPRLEDVGKDRACAGPVCSDNQARTAAQLIDTLKSGDPPIWLWDIDADQDIVRIRPTALQDGDEKIIVDRIKEVLKVH